MELAPGTVILKGHFNLLVSFQPVSFIASLHRKTGETDFCFTHSYQIFRLLPPLPHPTPLFPQPFLSVCLSV